MKKQTILAAILLSLFCIGAHAQTVSEAANVVTICPTEGCTVTAISAPATLQFGAGAAWVNLTSPTLPLTASCTGGCPAQIGADPASGIAKTLVAVEQTTAYTVTLSTGVVVSVPAAPALPPPVACLPISMPSTQTLPRNCILAPSAVVIGTDGALVAIDMDTQPQVYLQYCQGTVCNPPFVWRRQPLTVGPNSSMGGSTGGSGLGTLYAFPGQGAVTIMSAAGPVVTHAIPGGAQ